MKLCLVHSSQGEMLNEWLALWPTDGAFIRVLTGVTILKLFVEMFHQMSKRTKC